MLSGSLDRDGLGHALRGLGDGEPQHAVLHLGGNAVAPACINLRRGAIILIFSRSFGILKWGSHCRFSAERRKMASMNFRAAGAENMITFPELDSSELTTES